MSEQERVFLVKPGDTIVFGNLGDLGHDSLMAMSRVLHDEMGLRVVCFAADIDLSVVPGYAEGV